MGDGFLTTLFGGQDASSDDLGPANPPATGGDADAPASGDPGTEGGGSHAGNMGNVEPLDDAAA